MSLLIKEGLWVLKRFVPDFPLLMKDGVRGRLERSQPPLSLPLHKGEKSALPNPSKQKKTWRVLFYVLHFGLIFLYVNAFRSTFIDDAFIQFKYADTLVRHGNWGFYAGQTTNTATSPLNVLALALLSFMTRSVVISAVWLTTILLFSFLIIAKILSQKIFANSFFGYLLFFGLAANPLLLSCLGMESILFIVLLVAALTLFFFQRWYCLAIILALLTLARPDGVLLFLTLLIPIFRNTVSAKTRILFVALYVALLSPWHLYSWVHLGSFVPDTLIIKTNQQAWYGDVSFGTGLGRLYFRKFPFEILLSLFLLPFAFLGYRSPNRSAHQLMLLVLIYTAVQFIAYSALRVPPYHWYYAALAFGCVLSGCISIACYVAKRPGIRWILILLPLMGLLCLRFPLREAPIHTNWATHDQYKEVGEWLRQNTDSAATFIMAGEIGTLAYYSDRILLNNFSDGWLMQRLLNRNVHKQSGLFKLNYMWRKEAKRYPRSSYILEYVPSTHPERKGPDIVKSWKTSCKWIPEGTIYLRTRK